ncbi:unannotated protein [freshwater metagenome]|uniref:Unannotated protein n=1 Tax=freshwater metagenome TaxID=449393 RepID=A0A6J6UEA0_9ZZZZ
MRGIARTTSHAPLVNLVTSTITSTDPVMTRPKELMIRERFIRRRSAASVSARRWRFQWRTMPIWLSVKETNTPMMYSWMRAVTSAW